MGRALTPGTIPAAARLRVNGHGPVSADCGRWPQRSATTVKVSVMARTEAEARRMLDQNPFTPKCAAIRPY